MNVLTCGRPRRRTLVFGSTLRALVAGTGCAGSSSDVKPEVWRTRLRSAMDESVETRDRRDELSRVLVDAYRKLN